MYRTDKQARDGVIGLNAYANKEQNKWEQMKLTNSVAQEPEGSSPQPATGPCPEPVESNPHPPSQSP
jgi:hypothetical protein